MQWRSRYIARPEPGGSIAGLADQLVVLSLRADPKPHQPVRHTDRQGAVTITHPHRLETTDLLEMEGWIARFRLQTIKCLVG